jgi:predicted ATPase
VSANQEAIQHFRQALKLLETLPESIERDKQELTFQLALTVPLMAAQGFASPELGRAATRARDLCQKFGDPPEVFMALTQICLYYATCPEYRKALEIGDQMFKLAEMLDDPMTKAIAYYSISWPWLNLGELTRALELTERMSEVYDPEKYGYLAYVFGYDLGVMSQAFGSWCLWLLGYPDRAEKQMETALSHARKIGHPHTLAFALTGAIVMQWFLRNREGIDRYVDELGPISYENGFIFFIGHVLIYQGEKKTLEGEVEEGIAQMWEGVATIRATGSETCLTRLQARMGDACLQAGEIEEGLRAVGEGLGFKDRFEELYMEAELLRLKGELLRLKGADEREAEECFQKAIKTAQGQKAKSLELRAVMSLSRLLQKQGRGQDAKPLLEEVYGWFTEGFDRPDLQDAKALLSELL